MTSIARTVALSSLALAAACISSAPPAAPLRWFDPLPAIVTPAAGAQPVPTFRVDAESFLGREFVVRVGEREVAIDARHAWMAEPRQIVAAALTNACGGRGDERVAHVLVDRFELDVQGAPRAHVRLLVDGLGARRIVDEWGEAPSRDPQALATAMSQALGRAVGAVIAAGGGPQPAVR